MPTSRMWSSWCTSSVIGALGGWWQAPQSRRRGLVRFVGGCTLSKNSATIVIATPGAPCGHPPPGHPPGRGGDPCARHGLFEARPGPPSSSSSRCSARSSPVPPRRQTPGSTKVAPVVVRGCTAFAGAKALGYYYADAYVRVYACGARPRGTGEGRHRPRRAPLRRVDDLLPRLPVHRAGGPLPEGPLHADAGHANGAQAVDRYAGRTPPCSARSPTAPSAGPAQGRRAQPVQEQQLQRRRPHRHRHLLRDRLCRQRLCARDGAELGRHRWHAAATTATR